MAQYPLSLIGRVRRHTASMTAQNSDSSGPVDYRVTDGVATIRLNRPEAMNSLDIATKELLRETCLLYTSPSPRDS